MSNWKTIAGRAWNGVLADRRGVAGIEFALALPVLLLLSVGIVEVGRVVNQTTSVHKALRAAASYAARHPVPLDSSVETQIENMVKYGDPAGGAHYLLSGWAKPEASFAIDTSSFSVDGQPVGGIVIPVIRLSASVPYDSILGDLLPIPPFSIKASHDQAYIGD